MIGRFAIRAAQRLSRLRRNEDGSTIIEFAIVFPVLLLFVFGSIELSAIIFISSSIESAVMEASRYGSTGETRDGLSRDERILAIVEADTYGLVDMDAVDLETLVYENFGDIGQPEPFTDENGNTAYDDPEPYTDVNGNGQWDADMGAAGLGGAGDVVVYRLVYAWGIMTPFIQGVLGEDFVYSSSVAVRNEPF